MTKTLTESDLMKIVNKVLNEQEIRQFNEDEIELINFIFERELKPPFRKGERNYYNRDDEWIGWVDSDKDFTLRNPILFNIRYKVCQVFQFPYNTSDGWLAIKPHLKSWLENQLNVKLNNIYRY